MCPRIRRQFWLRYAKRHSQFSSNKRHYKPYKRASGGKPCIRGSWRVSGKPCSVGSWEVSTPSSTVARFSTPPQLHLLQGFQPKISLLQGFPPLLQGFPPLSCFTWCKALYTPSCGALWSQKIKRHSVQKILKIKRQLRDRPRAFLGKIKRHH